MQYHSTGLSLALALATALVPRAAAADCTDLKAGVVVDFQGGSANYELIRGERRVAISFFSEARNGDRLRLLQAGRISIQRGNGQIQNISQVGSWFCIRSGPPVRPFDNFVRNLGDLLTAARDGVGSLITRGDGDLALAPRTLADGTAVVGTGSRSLALAWQGGVAPFSVEIGQAGRAPIVSEADIHARLLRLREPRMLASGRYTVRVRDATGAVVEGTFSASGHAPANPGSAEEAMGIAARLLEAGPSHAYDAFLVLSPFRAQSQSASQLMDLVTVDQ